MHVSYGILQQWHHLWQTEVCYLMHMRVHVNFKWPNCKSNSRSRYRNRHRVVIRLPSEVRSHNHLDQFPAGNGRHVLIDSKLQLPGTWFRIAIDAREPKPRRVLMSIGEHMRRPFFHSPFSFGNNEMYSSGWILQRKLNSNPQSPPFPYQMGCLFWNNYHQLSRIVVRVCFLRSFQVAFRENLQRFILDFTLTNVQERVEIVKCGFVAVIQYHTINTTLSTVQTDDLERFFDRNYRQLHESDDALPLEANTGQAENLMRCKGEYKIIITSPKI